MRPTFIHHCFVPADDPSGPIPEFWSVAGFQIVPTPKARIWIGPYAQHKESVFVERELILNYFRAQKLFSSGVVGGLNNKAKVTMRKSCGFRTFRILELALYHSLAKLPEPQVTHDFF